MERQGKAVTLLTNSHLFEIMDNENNELFLQ